MVNPAFRLVNGVVLVTQCWLEIQVLSRMDWTIWCDFLNLLFLNIVINILVTFICIYTFLSQILFLFRFNNFLFKIIKLLLQLIRILWKFMNWMVLKRLIWFFLDNFIRILLRDVLIFIFVFLSNLWLKLHIYWLLRIFFMLLILLWVYDIGLL